MMQWAELLPGGMPHFPLVDQSNEILKGWFSFAGPAAFHVICGSAGFVV